MRIKNIIILALVLALSMFVTGCTTKVVDKAPEGPAVTEGDKVEDEVKDEEKVEDVAPETQSDWPASFMATAPELKGNIVLNDERGEHHKYVGYEELDYDSAVAYVEDLKAAGFTVHAFEKINDSLVKYKGFNNENQLVKFFWTANGRAGVDLIIKDGVM